MKRYGLFYQNGHDGEMEESVDGDWVKYEDAIELRRQLATEARRMNETLTVGAKLMHSYNRVKEERDELQRQLAAALNALKNILE